MDKLERAGGDLMLAKCMEFLGVRCQMGDELGLHGSWWKVPAALSLDGAPSARLVALIAQAAPAHPRAPRQHRGNLPWPQQPASARLKS